MKQGDLSITKYFTKLHIVWDELENFRPDPTCSCTVRCTCLALTAFAQRKLKDRAIQFLRGLNEQYSNVRSHVLLMDPLPTISKIFSFVAQQERQLFGNNLMAGVSLEPKGSMINAVKSTCDFVEELDTLRTCVTRSTVFLPIMKGEAKRLASRMEGHALIMGKSDTPLMYVIGSMTFPQDTGFLTQEALQTA